MMIKEFYDNNGKFDLEEFKEKYPDLEIYWETLAAIGVATGSMQLLDYADEYKGGHVNVCVALDNLVQEGREEIIEQFHFPMDVAADKAEKYFR